MNSGIIVIGVAILITSIFISVIKNIKKIITVYNNVKKNNIVKCIFFILIIIFIIWIIKFLYTSIKSINNNIEFYKITKKNNEFFEEFDKKIEEENEFYNEIIQKEYGAIKKEPYIPDGFTYVEGDSHTGFVIQDIEGNQYVWIPCTNKEDEKIAKLEKKNFYQDLDSVTFINHNVCADDEYKEFLESALKYGGFYISRFEIGTENGKIVSKLGAKVLTNVTRKEFLEKIDNMYENRINYKLINGYAYDTTLSWINKNNIADIDVKDYSQEKEEVLCGRVKYNNIYDIFDNVVEITLENYYDTIVSRGFHYDEEQRMYSRYSVWEEILEHTNQINLLAYRTVMYK